MSEVWLPVVGYEAYYEVSNKGQVKSLERIVQRRYSGGHVDDFLKKESILKQSTTTTGYKKVELTVDAVKKSFKVHRLVAIAFLENPDSKPYINHIDNNPINNVLENLEWCTQSENMIHAYKIGAIPSNLHLYMEEIISEYNKGVSKKALTKKYNCGEQSLDAILRQREIKVRGIGEAKDQYKIDRKEMVSLFEKGMKDRAIADLFKTNRGLIATYRCMYRKGELKF